MFEWFSRRRELKRLRNMLSYIQNEYETKKAQLLVLHQKEASYAFLQKYVIEINVLADILNKDKLDVNKLEDTLFVYPNGEVYSV